MLRLIDRRLNARNKSAVNRERFIRRYKDHIRRAVKDMVADRSIKDMIQGGEVKVPAKDVSEPGFRYGHGGDWDGVYPGNREFVSGDRIPRPSGGGRGAGGSQPGQGESVDDFVFTLSRASYLGVVPVFLGLTALATRRRALVAVLLLVVVCSPFLLLVAPASVVDRVLYTFQPEANQPTVRLGKVGLDPSTSARILSFQQALKGWTERPILGWGVTGFGFMDAQYARVLVETGILGFAVFVWLVCAVLQAARAAHRRLTDPVDRGLAMGFIAGTIGLLAHAIGSNTFTIIRIMEPFWLIAGIVVMLPVLVADEWRAIAAPPAPAVAAPVLR